MKPISLSRSSVQLWAGGVLVVCLMGCRSEMPVTEGYPHQLAMRGKTREEVLQCAGAPLRERHSQGVSALVYYREAPILEESGIISKGSLPKVHHGCWVTVLLRQGRIVNVQYQFVPEFFNAANDCERVFEHCGVP